MEDRQRQVPWNHVVVLGERHLRRVLTAYRTYYHRARALTSRSTRMHPTAGQLSGGTSAGSFPSPKSVACTIATSDGRPDPAQSVRHARARPSVSALPRAFTSFRGGRMAPKICMA